MKPNLKQPLTSGERWYRGMIILTAIIACLFAMKCQNDKAAYKQHIQDSLFTDSITKANLGMQGGDISKVD